MPIADAGLWTWFPATEQIKVCANFLGLLGQPDLSTSMTFDEWLGFVEPEDRRRGTEKFISARAKGFGSPSVMATQLCRKDGRCRWFYMHADWYRKNEEDAYVMNGVNVDIHELTTAGEGLRLAVDKRQGR